MWQNGIARFAEGKTVEETLAKAKSENSFDPTYRRSINESFVPSGFKQLPAAEQRKRIARAERITEELFWKFKGIYDTLNGTIPFTNKKDVSTSLKGKDGSIISILETTGGVRDMSISAFYNQPGEYLALVKEIRVKNQ
jgi:hypothetical protein